jgi:hypothetical protein
MKWLFALGLIALVAIGLWLMPQTGNRAIARVEADPGPSPVAVGTAGTHDATAETDAPDVITEIETITGANDGMGLVGRRVDLHVDVQNRANDYAFWVGPRDNRLLVVLARDTRDGSQRQQGRPSGHRISPVHGGQRAAISGIIRRVPKDEHRYSWNLTRDDDRELADRKIYIAADSVSSEGHGSH